MAFEQGFAGAEFGKDLVFEHGSLIMGGLPGPRAVCQAWVHSEGAGTALRWTEGLHEGQTRLIPLIRIAP
ncbi:hypothetical protein NSE01_12150 [Novosphingobium sediminis]|uniref:Uncharacterized protein n=1 Tax=Novosphingobium sediminis TaxID=707214 RepID=A0A512AID2_9SPHN|nr:hypothetical protein NSE01_12150 [Novosphingobium sediminis]